VAMIMLLASSVSGPHTANAIELENISGLMAKVCAKHS
jgi:hypothetical protein